MDANRSTTETAEAAAIREIPGPPPIRGLVGCSRVSANGDVLGWAYLPPRAILLIRAEPPSGSKILMEGGENVFATEPVEVLAERYAEALYGPATADSLPTYGMGAGDPVP